MAKADWKKIKTEYVTTQISQRALAEKYGLNLVTINAKSKKEGWVQARKEYINKAQTKAIQKSCDKEAEVLSGLYAISLKLEAHLAKMVEDSEQFNRHLVTNTYKTEDGGMVIATEEQIFQKYDDKAMKNAVAALKDLEIIKRSLKNLPREQERERFEMEKERWQLEKKKADDAETMANDVVHIKMTDGMEEWSE